MPHKIVLLPVLLALLAVGAALLPAADESSTADEELLKKAGVGTSEADLVAFLRKQTLPDKERRQSRT